MLLFAIGMRVCAFVYVFASSFIPIRESHVIPIADSFPKASFLHFSSFCYSPSPSLSLLLRLPLSLARFLAVFKRFERCTLFCFRVFSPNFPSWYYKSVPCSAVRGEYASVLEHVYVCVCVSLYTVHDVHVYV